MGLPEDILKLLKSEDYKRNAAIEDALKDFLDIVTEENEELEEEGEDGDDEVEGVDGLKAER